MIIVQLNIEDDFEEFFDRKGGRKGVKKYAFSRKHTHVCSDM